MSNIKQNFQQDQQINSEMNNITNNQIPNYNKDDYIQENVKFL